MDKVYQFAGMTVSEKDLVDAIRAYNNGTTDFTVDGECIGCGECCSNLLPMSNSEVKKIKKIVRAKGIKPINHIPAPVINAIDWKCPFCDDSRGDKKCVIYDSRPLICRDYCCSKQHNNEPPAEEFIIHTKDYIPRNVRKTFWDEKGNAL